jgi:hypothetical protein
MRGGTSPNDITVRLRKMGGVGYEAADAIEDLRRTINDLMDALENIEDATSEDHIRKMAIEAQ